MSACPICATITDKQRAGSPYWMCSGCGAWFQDPMPPKRWHGDHEHWLGLPMPQAEKDANESLCDSLFRNVMHSKPGNVLDIGASYPYLLSRFKARGCEVLGFDGEPQRNDLGILVAQFDLDTVGLPTPGNPLGPGPQSMLICCVHSFEHFYDPVSAFHKLRWLTAEGGAIFIRMPDNMVDGYERDLTPGHFTIHPWFHSLSSIAELCARTKTFRIESALELRPGQRDIVLRPL
jgi:SAM-dependent methyltransferase